MLGTFVGLALLVLLIVIGGRLVQRVARNTRDESHVREEIAALTELSTTSDSQSGEIEYVQALYLSDPSGECDFHIVGESNYQPELRRVAKSGRAFRAVLAAERTNPHDSNAIRVIAENGKTIGYLSREYAVDYREVFALLEQHGRVGVCPAKLIGGIGHKKSFGVMLNLKDPESLLSDIRDTLAPGSAVSESVQPF